MEVEGALWGGQNIPGRTKPGQTAFPYFREGHVWERAFVGGMSFHTLPSGLRSLTCSNCEVKRKAEQPHRPKGRHVMSNRVSNYTRTQQPMARWASLGQWKRNRCQPLVGQRAGLSGKRPRSGTLMQILQGPLKASIMSNKCPHIMPPRGGCDAICSEVDRFEHVGLVAPNHIPPAPPVLVCFSLPQQKVHVLLGLVGIVCLVGGQRRRRTYSRKRGCF